MTPELTGPAETGSVPPLGIDAGYVDENNGGWASAYWGGPSVEPVIGDAFDGAFPDGPDVDGTGTISREVSVDETLAEPSINMPIGVVEGLRQSAVIAWHQRRLARLDVRADRPEREVVLARTVIGDSCRALLRDNTGKIVDAQVTPSAQVQEAVTFAQEQWGSGTPINRDYL